MFSLYTLHSHTNPCGERSETKHPEERNEHFFVGAPKEFPQKRSLGRSRFLRPNAQSFAPHRLGRMSQKSEKHLPALPGKRGPTQKKQSSGLGKRGPPNFPERKNSLSEVLGHSSFEKLQKLLFGTPGKHLQKSPLHFRKLHFMTKSFHCKAPNRREIALETQQFPLNSLILGDGDDGFSDFPQKPFGFLEKPVHPLFSGGLGFFPSPGFPNLLLMTGSFTLSMVVFPAFPAFGHFRPEPPLSGLLLL